MDEILNFLKESGCFFVATCDGDQPRVRPFGFFMEYEGRLYLSSGKHKSFFSQVCHNCKVELCALKPNKEWMRVSGVTVVDDRPEVKERALEHSPNLKRLYGSAENPNLTLIYLKDMKANICSHTTQPRPVAL